MNGDEVVKKLKEEYDITVDKASVGRDFKNIFIHPKNNFEIEIPEEYEGFNIYVGDYLPQMNSEPPRRKVK